MRAAPRAAARDDAFSRQEEEPEGLSTANRPTTTRPKAFDRVKITVLRSSVLA